MNSRLIVPVLVLTVVACGPKEGGHDSDGTWVGTITTQGDVTTVVNASGSVWDGPASLVEEASIGVESGADEHMLDTVFFVYATEERIYVPQPRIPIVRTYDHTGRFLGNLGRRGQGPGEHTDPRAAAAVAGGRAYVWDLIGGRINVYDANGEPVDTWPFQVSGGSWPMAMSSNGKLRVPVVEYARDMPEMRFGVQTFGATGREGPVMWAPKIDYDRQTVTFRGSEIDVLFGPMMVWAAAPEGLVVGATDRYRFEVVRSDGSRMVVHRYWQPVPVSAEESAWTREWMIAGYREDEPFWQWNGDDIPSYKPAYNTLIPSGSGEIWVVRSGPGERVEGCSLDRESDAPSRLERDYNPCWPSGFIVDAFGADGRYLGEVEIPEGFHLSAGQARPYQPNLYNLFVAEDIVLLVVEDDAGTIMVKCYRLVLPGER
jgi:hypothetical protein